MHTVRQQMRKNMTSPLRVCPHRASAAAGASPLEYIVTLGNKFSSITMYSNGDARCGQTLSSMPQ